MTKILVIDDELEICKQISLILSKQGYEVTYANSYKEFTDLELRNFESKHLAGYSRLLL